METTMIGHERAAAVIGSGIAGMQAALLLAEMGRDVYLLEREAFIGGKFPFLDITFPTNSCGICFLGSRQPAYCPVYECRLHEKIEILALTEVLSIGGKGGDFQLTLRRHPRMVDGGRCTRCGKCEEACPVEAPDPWGGLETHKAVYRPSFQAIPDSYAIDGTYCTRCGRCASLCPSGAIDLEQEAEETILRVGAVIDAQGFEPFDAWQKGEYGFGRYDNVLTSFQFERMLSPSGPTGGMPARRSDGKKIKKLAIIQCVGSRDLSYNQEHCSSICCMIAAKQALLAKQRASDMTITLFYMDIRPLGKDYERYFEAVRTTEGILYRRAAVSSIHEISRTKDLLLGYAGEEGKVHEESFDAVVLAVGYKAPPPALSAPGLFTARLPHGPGDISETVVAGAGAAALAAAFLAPGPSASPESGETCEEKADQGPPRMGILFCSCSRAMFSPSQFDDLLDRAGKLPGVVHVEVLKDGCFDRDAPGLPKAMKDRGVNRLILAGCNPRDKGAFASRISEETGCRPSLIACAGIRAARPVQEEGGERDGAFFDAWAAVRMAWERARRLQPLPVLKRELAASVLVIGAGPAGMTASLRLAALGHEVVLLEREAEPGGSARDPASRLSESDSSCDAAEWQAQIATTPSIHLWTECEVVSTVRSDRGYTTEVRRPDGLSTVRHGALVLATGGRETAPSGFAYGEAPGVITQRQLGSMLDSGKTDLGGIDSIVMIQCVNSRDREHPYCSRVCCIQAIKHSLIIKEGHPRIRIYILYRDVRTGGRNELYYRRAREAGVIFIPYEAEAPPEVTAEAGNLLVSAYDPFLQEQVALRAGLLVLSTGMEPADIRGLADLFSVEVDESGFLKAANPKAAPLDSLNRGVFYCGLGLAPNATEDVIAQANAAAARVAAYLAGTGEQEPSRSYVVKRFCSRCGVCVAGCPYRARSFNEEGEIAVADDLCRGCGACVASCSSNASRQFNQEKQMHMGILDAALE